MTSNVSVEFLTEEDIDLFLNFLHSLIGSMDCYNESAKQEQIEFYTKSFMTTNCHNPNWFFVLAKLDHKVVGIRIAEIDTDMIHLHWIGVDPDFRRKGIATQMYNFLFDYIQTTFPFVRKAWCDTRTDNIISNHNLTQLGFTVVATLRNFWYDQDYFIWEKQL